MSTPPPLYPESRSRPQPPARPPAPAKKPGRSGCAIAAIVAAVVGVLGLVVIAILAAIALPAYQEYVMRTRVVQAVSSSQQIQLAIAAHQAAHGACPDAEAFAQIASEPMAIGGGGSSASVAWEWVEPVDDRCGFTLKFAGIGVGVDGTTLGFRQQDSGWTCDEGTLPPRFRRLSCASNPLAGSE